MIKKLTSTLLAFLGLTSNGICEMNEEKFWKLIEESRLNLSSPYDQSNQLVDLLKKESKEDIIGFDRIFTAKRFESYRWDFWAVAYILNGGCSDDGFEYFRCWVIGNGKSAFESALKDPVSMANLTSPDNDMNENEELMYAASIAYEVVTGSKMPYSKAKYPEIKGEEWNEEELPNRYPALCNKYGWN